MSADINDLRTKMNEKMNTEEGVRIWRNFDRYASYDDYKDLYMKVLPEIQKFE